MTPQAGLRKGLAECLSGWSTGAQECVALLRLGDRRAVTRGYPPQHGALLAEAAEPFQPSAEDRPVSRAVNEGQQHRGGDR
jgi:hypothetical protein